MSTLVPDQTAVAFAYQELAYARTKWPLIEHLTLALMEEAGKACKAALDYRNARTHGAGPHTQFTLLEELRRRLASTTAVSIRIATEGDSSLGIPVIYPPAGGVS